MIGLYVGAALFGGIVIGVSLLFGGGDNDSDHDHDHDHDVEKHLEVDKAFDKHVDLAKDVGKDIQWLWMPLLSMRFWTFFTATFGVTGTLLSLFLSEPLPAIVSIPFGVGMGYLAAYVFTRLRTDNVSGDTSLGQYAGLEAKVLVPVRPGEIGKIAVQTMSGRVEMPATTRDGTVLDAGAVVLIASVVNGSADVTGLGNAPSAQTTLNDVKVEKS